MLSLSQFSHPTCDLFFLCLVFTEETKLEYRSNWKTTFQMFHYLFLPSLSSTILNFSFLQTYLPCTLRVTSSFTLIFILVRFVIPSTKRNSHSSLDSTRNLCKQVPGKRFFTYIPSPLVCTRTHAHSQASTRTHSHTTRVPVMCAAIRGK
jgi:hypothetical protein